MTETSMTETSRTIRPSKWRRHWYTAALSLLALGTVASYLVNLRANGWANSFYAAAVQAGSENWEAFLFGSLDSANAITVDKPPAALWLMALSARVFGFSSFSMLLPEVLLAGVSVLLIAHSTRLALRGHVSPVLERAAAVGAAGIFALSPVVALMFRFNNPDALLVTLMVASVVATQRALRTAAGRHDRAGLRIGGWLVLAGVCLGLGFLTKQFQVLLIVPGLAAAWVLFARTSWVRRVLWLLVPIGWMVISAGWWIALVELTPADSRPYVGGSQTNSFLELTFGYNGFGRLTGNETGSVGGGGGGGQGGGWGETGITRLFTGSFGQQVSWFLPTALFLLLVTIVLLMLAEVARRRGAAASTHGVKSCETDAVNRGSLGAAVLMWGAWLVVTWLVLSHMNGIVHEYYTVALVPAIAVVIGIGVAVLLSRPGYVRRLLLAVAWALTGAWQFIISSEMSGIPEWLRWGVLIVSVLGGLCLIVTAHLRPARALASVLVAVAILGSSAIPAQLSVRTIAGTTQGSIVTIAGTSSGMGGPGGGGGGGGMPGGGGAPGGGNTPDGNGTERAAGGPGGGGGGGMGGLLSGSEPSDELTELLSADADDYTWAAAATGANQAAGYQLALEEPVMAIGGFNGTDPSPTLVEFKQLVADGQIHYYIGSGSGGGAGGSDTDSSSAQIAAWVQANFAVTTVDDVSLYDLSGE